jgi:hypothetical protein
MYNKYEQNDQKDLASGHIVYASLICVQMKIR